MGSNLVFEGEISARGAGTLRFKGFNNLEPVAFIVNGVSNVVSGGLSLTGTVNDIPLSSATGTGAAIRFPVHQPGHGFVIGTPITESATGWVKSENDVMTSTADAIVGGVVGPDDFIGQQFGTLTLSTAQWDALCGTSGGLVKGTYYWVAAIAGTYTDIQPSGPVNFQQISLKALSSVLAEVLLPSEAMLSGVGASTTNSIGAQWDSGTAIVVSSAHPVDRYIDRAGTVSGVRLLTYGGPGSCVVDIYKSAFAAFPPAASICASSKPTIVGGNTYQDIVLSGWTTAVAAGDVLRFVLVSCSTFLRVSVFLGF